MSVGDRRGSFREPTLDRGAIHDRSFWVAVRTWSDQPDGRKRFAHTGAWYFEVDQQPVRPPVQQIDYLLQQLEASLENSAES